jgi:lipoprotein NlpI
MVAISSSARYHSSTTSTSGASRMRFLIPLFLLSIAPMNTACAADADEAIKKTQQALKSGDNEAALKAADEAVKLDPQNATAWFLHGEAQSRFRKHAEAIKDYNKVLELDPKFVAAVNQRGGERFKMGDVKGSIEDFEAYIKVKPEAYDDHWRYGISLYYAGRFADGAKQFKAGEKAFGNDVENAFFHYICNARSDGFEKARKNILKIGNDSRVTMMKTYELIQGKAKPEEVLATVDNAKLKGEEKNEALFYAHLYIGLNYEAEGNEKKCLEHLTTAVEKYKISHYMWDVGNVHLQLAKKK